MDFLQQSFSVKFQYRVNFTEHLFHRSNMLFSNTLKENHQVGTLPKILFVIDEGVASNHPALSRQIDEYFEDKTHVQLVSEKVLVAGGEIVKNEEIFFTRILEAVSKYGIDRHSYVAAIGGGSVLDLAGYVTAVSHRGIKHIRIPTTVLSQNDSGVGVKNGINYLGKKNFLGTFAPPFAVFNDFEFLTTLSDRDWRSGISEAIKVALIKDAPFFYWLEKNAEALVQRDRKPMQYLIRRCAELHLEHIAGGDPFEAGSSRPLDFGHWSAHKLEQLSNFSILHGEAVAIGIALDSAYSCLSGRLSSENYSRIIRVLKSTGLPIAHPLVKAGSNDSPLLTGLQEFQEHLGGRLTIMLLKDIGQGEEVHEMDRGLIEKAAKQLQDLH